MNEDTKKEDVIEKKDVTSTSTEEQDPLKTELERVQRTGKTEAEKAAFSLKKNAERARELGIDPGEVLGLHKTESESGDSEDDTPVTVGMLKKIQQETAAKTALQLAEEIPNESERELTKFHLQNSIKSTGNPTEDIKLARALVNAAKNSKIIEEMGRKTDPVSHSRSSGADARSTEIQGELTEKEKAFLGKPFNMTKDQILKARQK